MDNNLESTQTDNTLMARMLLSESLEAKYGPNWWQAPGGESPEAADLRYARIALWNAEIARIKGNVDHVRYYQDVAISFNPSVSL